MSTVGAALRNLRQTAQLTRREVAELADTTPRYLAKVESGKRTPSRLYVACVANAIALSLVASSSRAA